MNRLFCYSSFFVLVLGLLCTTSQGAELLKNQNFQHGFVHWMLHVHKDMITKRSISNGVLNIQTQVAGSAANVQLMQNVSIQEGQQYQLSFEARHQGQASPVKVLCMQRNKPYHNYGLNQTVHFSDTWSRYELTFTANRILKNNSPTLRLFLGNQAGLIQLKNFSLTPIKKEQTTTASQSQHPQIWQGIYALTNKPYPVKVDGKTVDLLNAPGSAGVTYYDTWRKCEPTKGQWNLGNFQRWFAQARKADRKLNIALLAGSHVPDWALKESKSSLYQYMHVKTNSVRRNYLPWTLVNGQRVINEPMLKVWRTSVEQFSQKIRSQPEFKKTLGYIAITGGPYSNGLEIMWGVNKMADGSTFAWGPKEDQFLITYWQRCIDIYMDVFPDVPLGLAFTDVYGRTSNGQARRNTAVPKAIMDYAVEQAKLKNVKLIAQGFWIGAGAGDSHWALKHPDDNIVRTQSLNYPMLKETHPLQKILLSYRQNTTIAYQGPMGTSTATYLRQMIKFAREHDALFLELWHHDFAEPKYLPLIKENQAKP